MPSYPSPRALLRHRRRMAQSFYETVICEENEVRRADLEPTQLAVPHRLFFQQILSDSVQTGGVNPRNLIGGREIINKLLSKPLIALSRQTG